MPATAKRIPLVTPEKRAELARSDVEDATRYGEAIFGATLSLLRHLTPDEIAELLESLPQKTLSQVYSSICRRATWQEWMTFNSVRS